MRVYLAGPDVFLPEPMKMAQAKQKICQKYGFEGIFPFDQELDFKNLTPREAGLAIYSSNIKLMDGCDLMVANITPFRSPSLDAGTAFEIGYMTAQGKPIFAYSNEGRLYAERVTNKQTATLDQNGMLIEEFEMIDNLMLEGAIVSSGGAITFESVELSQYYTELKYFENIVKIAAERLLSRL